MNSFTPSSTPTAADHAVVELPVLPSAPQLGTTFVDVVIDDLVPYLEAFDRVESLLVLNELQRRLAELEEEYQAYANWVADDTLVA